VRCDKKERRKQACKYALNNFSLKNNIREVEKVYEEAII